MKTDPSDPMYHFRNASHLVKLIALFIIEKPYKEAVGRLLLIVLLSMAPSWLGVKHVATEPPIPNGTLSVAIQDTNLDPTTPVKPGRPAGQATANVPPADK